MMKIQDCNLKAYADQLQSIPLNRVGIDRLIQVASCPDGKLVEDVQPIFGAFCEFVTFNECIRRPFFEILSTTLNNKMGSLFSLLLANNKSSFSLTYEEAFEFFMLIGKKQVRDILDSYKCNSFTYNGVLDAIAQKDYAAFLSALGSADYHDMMATLWQLRYILLGIKSSGRNNSKGRLENNNLWITGADFSAYFRAFTSVYEDKFVENRVKSYISHSLVEKPRRQRITRELNDDELQQLYSATTIADGRYYSEWIDKFTKMSFDQLGFATYLDSITNRDSEIIADGEAIAHLIIKMAVNGHKPELIQHFQLDPINCKDGADWDEYYCDYHNTDKLGDYIIIYTAKMLYIYNNVKNVLSDEERCILEWLIGCSRYTNFFMNGTSEAEIVLAVESPIVEDTTDTRPLTPPDIQNRKRLRNDLLINRTCEYLQSWFKGANIKDIKFVFFGIGERPSKSLELTTQKSNLCMFISYLIGKKNIQKETWIHFAFCINFRGKPVFPTDPDDKAWVSNPPSGLAKAKDKEEYENSGFRLILENSLNRKLTKEEQEDVK